MPYVAQSLFMVFMSYETSEGLYHFACKIVVTFSLAVHVGIFTAITTADCFLKQKSLLQFRTAET